MNDRKLPRALRLGLVLVVVPCLALVGLEIYQVFWNAPRITKSQEAIVRALEVLGTARSAARAVRDAERQQRALIISGDTAYGEPYRNEVREARSLLARLKKLTSDNPAQRTWLPELEQKIEAKLAQLQRTLDANEQGGVEAARELMRSDAPADVMHEIDRVIEEAVAAEKALLNERASRDERRTTEAALAAALLALLIMTTGIVMVRSAFRDMRGSETARRRSEERFRLFVEGVSDYAIFLLDPKGYIINWNLGAERIKGYSAEEIIGQHFSRFYTEEDREAGLPRAALEAAAQLGKYEMEGWRVRKDGSRFIASVVIEPRRDASGRLLGFAKITRDVTERVKQQQALEEARAALAQSQKLEALGQLSGGVAHDFNNLLHVIKNAVEILERRLRAGDRDVGTYLEMVKRNADRAQSLTQRLLAFSRRQPLEPAPIDPNRLVRGITELLRPTLGGNVSIQTALGSGVWWVFADANQLETAILNLAINARDAMPEGGNLTIETTNAYLDASYASIHEEVEAGQYVMISVSDNGAGMTEETAARAFEPFFTTKDVGRGTGLGLSQVYGFIKQSGGHIKIHSKPNEGTTVKLYLPRPSGADAAAIPGEERPAHPGPARETVLVVDEDADVFAFTAEVLRELGYRVLGASSARAAIEALEKESNVDLLFTDVDLPHGVNGRQLADDVLKRRPGIRVLFATAYAGNAMERQGRLDPGIELIVKPFTQSALADKVRRVLDGGADVAARGRKVAELGTGA